ncbi:hypothetical protein COT29_02515 [Candidatus Micrarchaeota archaeon CG08_land_8_20_14_0_20_59_11]|nr:MAG: hypothetical protein COT29_02515 [Candidatus Micrarchaeota archaeon CG08_land_8_20_14_0_20_59_11]
MHFDDLNAGNCADAAKLLGWSVALATPAVEGENARVTKRLASEKGALVLFHESFGRGNRELLAVAKEREHVFEFPIRPLLHAPPQSRPKLMAAYRSFLSACVKRRIPFVFTSRGQDALDVKTPREVIAIAQFLGLTRQQAAASITETPKRFLE